MNLQNAITLFSPRNLVCALFMSVLSACGGTSDEGHVVTVDGISMDKTIDKTGIYDLEVTGARNDVTVAAGNTVARLIVAGMNNRIFVLKTATGIGATTMAKRFIAGRNGREATSAIERLRRQNLTFTMDLLGEAVTSEHEALAYQKKYLELLEDLAVASKSWTRQAQTDTASWGDIPMVNVSIKLSSLYARFDPMARDATTEAVIARLLPIVRSAKEKGFIVNFDMEQNDFRDVTFHIFRTMFLMDEFRTWDNAGIVCQAYL